MTQYFPYFKAEVAILPDLCGDLDQAEQLAKELLELSQIVLAKKISVGGPVSGQIQHRIKALVLWVYSWLDLKTSCRQALIELPSAVAQARFLIERLKAIINLQSLPQHQLQKREVIRKGNLIEINFQS
jgi:hypothetical protein